MPVEAKYMGRKCTIYATNGDEVLIIYQGLKQPKWVNVNLIEIKK